MHMMLLLLAACGINEDNFADKFGALACDQYEDCEPDNFDDDYDSFDDCLDDAVPLFEEVQDWGEEVCGIDYDLATECYRDMKAMDCEEIEDGDAPPSCDDIYEDC
jgi:hypothetical protein